MNDFAQVTEVGVHRATIEIELTNGARLSLAVLGGDAVVKLYDDLEDLYLSRLVAVALPGRSRLRVEVDGAMDRFVFANPPSVGPT